MSRKIISALLLFFVVFSARAELVIEITKGADKPIPIAVVPFEWKGAGVPNEDVAQVVSDDLHRASRLLPMARENMLDRPSREQDVFIRQWAALGQDYLLIGQVEPIGKRYSASFKLFNVRTDNVILKGTVASGNLRTLAHRVSDEVYEKLTGVKGAFSTKILYVLINQNAPKRERYQLQFADADGHRYRTVLSSAEPISSPSWSPDGKRFAYVSFENQKPAVFIQELATGKRTRLPQLPGLNNAPAWSPDGTKLAIVHSKGGSSDIFVKDLVSGKLTQITKHWAIDTEPAWSPDGQTMLFTSDRGGSPQVYQYNFKDGKVKRVTFEGIYNARPSFTADGRYMVVLHQAKRGAGFQIGMFDMKTGRFSLLTDGQKDESPSVAPNGSMVLYATQEQGRGVLGAVSIDGGVRYRLPSKDGSVREPAWSPYLN